MAISRRVSGGVLALVWLASAPALAQEAAPAAIGIVRGVVVDRADGTAIGDVSVRVQDAGAPVRTDAEGRFELAGVPAGQQTLYVSVVGFILVKRTIDVRPSEPLELTIALSEGTGTYSEAVTVAGERFREQERSVPAQQTLGSGDIQNLRNLLTNDPMRAIQVLPGVSTGDDFRSEFVVRGSPFSRMTFTLDGVPTSFLLHTVQQIRDGGSIAMLNGDILDGITLLNGSYPQRYGNRLGAELDFHMREGSRDRAQLRFAVSGTDASMVAEGPLGGGKSGSWLVSARKSYLELLLKQIDDNDDFGFGFSDIQSKLVYDVAPAHRAELTIVAGRSRLDQESTVERAERGPGRPQQRRARQRRLAVHPLAPRRPHAAPGARGQRLLERERGRRRAGSRERARRHVAGRRRRDPFEHAHPRGRRAGAMAASRSDGTLPSRSGACRDDAEL